MTESKPRQSMRRVVLLTATVLGVASASVAPVCAGNLPATGQTTPYQARSNGDTMAVPVPDDGTLQRGATLKYKLLPDGTVKDMNTGLIWEMKCSGPGCPALHDVTTTYVWTGNGAMETIWNWLADINAEGGTGYAGHSDWRIPNLRELESIADYGSTNPAIAPIFGPTASSEYWSSTTVGIDSSEGWGVYFFNGLVSTFGKTSSLLVRGVRGGPK